MGIEGAEAPFRRRKFSSCSEPKFSKPDLVGLTEFEATVGIEPTVRVLQTHALPLGDVA